MEATTIQVHLAPRHRLTDETAMAYGLTKKAIEHKIADGKWHEGKQYHRDPEGRIWLDQKGVMRWVAKE
jgi:hypothetical protein